MDKTRCNGTTSFMRFKEENHILVSVEIILNTTFKKRLDWIGLHQITNVSSADIYTYEVENFLNRRKEIH
eukprot:snap_masked-scaffold_25-processed-gene-2.49-mRNA-1 protein AED:1.00 eAED:1.00 QI:0/-1/0/0/-1/1/1/0/69